MWFSPPTRHDTTPTTPTVAVVVRLCARCDVRTTSTSCFCCQGRTEPLRAVDGIKDAFHWTPTEEAA